MRTTGRRASIKVTCWLLADIRRARHLFILPLRFSEYRILELLIDRLVNDIVTAYSGASQCRLYASMTCSGPISFPPHRQLYCLPAARAQAINAFSTRSHRYH
jgi:hypothetical protein